jgi:hypothetical protein
MTSMIHKFITWKAIEEQATIDLKACSPSKRPFIRICEADFAGFSVAYANR